VAAIESNLRRISVSLEALNEGQSREQQASVSEASINPAWPDLNVTFQPAVPTPQA
jgi:hypothetical protein